MSKKIALSGERGRGKFAIVDDEDYDKLSRHRWHLTDEGYCATNAWNEEKGKVAIVRMHRSIANAPKHTGVDHRNRNKLDNRRTNLRVASQSMNMANQQKNIRNKSGYKGVYLDKKTRKWRACIKCEQTNINIGYFTSKRDAAYAYDQFAIQIFGEYALTNFLLGAV